MTGQQLRKARRTFALTQAEAAERLGVSQSYLSLFEKDYNEPHNSDSYLRWKKMIKLPRKQYYGNHPKTKCL